MEEERKGEALAPEQNSKNKKLQKRKPKPGVDLEALEQDSTAKKKLMPQKRFYRMRAHINPMNETLFP